MRVMCSNVVPVVALRGSFLRRAARVGGVAGMLMGVVWGGLSLTPVLAQESYLLAQAQAAPAGPMSRQEVAERLNLVPVFAIVSQDG
ncbi:MAG: hypothetical protein Q6K80_11240, partial [Thermostichus sp. DG_1_6_bins_120]